MGHEGRQYTTRDADTILGHLKGLNLKLRAIIGLLVLLCTGTASGVGDLLEPDRENVGHHQNLSGDRSNGSNHFNENQELQHDETP